MTTPICLPCIGLGCDNPDDLATGVDTAIYSTQDYSFVVQCPPGCICQAGLFPQTISILASTIPPVIPPILEPGETIVLKLQGCTALITRTLPGGSTQSVIAAAAQSMQAEWAGQQALCLARLEAGVNCNTGTSIQVCNDAQNFPCYNGTQEIIAAGTLCQTLVTTGLTQSQINAAIATIKANLNQQVRDTVCPFGGIICQGNFVTLSTPGTAGADLRFINVSGVSKDLTAFQFCITGGIPDPICFPPGLPAPPTSVGPNTFVDFAGGVSPVPLTGFDVFYLGFRIFHLTSGIPIGTAIRLEITLGCNG